MYGRYLRAFCGAIVFWTGMPVMPIRSPLSVVFYRQNLCFWWHFALALFCVLCRLLLSCCNWKKKPSWSMFVDSSCRSLRFRPDPPPPKHLDRAVWAFGRWLFFLWRSPGGRCRRYFYRDDVFFFVWLFMYSRLLCFSYFPRCLQILYVTLWLQNVWWTPKGPEFSEWFVLNSAEQSFFCKWKDLCEHYTEFALRRQFSLGA